MRTIEVNEVHVACMEDFKAVLVKYGSKLNALEMLALASQLVGNLIALQDQTKVTPASALATVSENIQIGNVAALNTVQDSKGSA